MEYPKSEKYARLASAFLYVSRMRSILGRIEIRREDLLSLAASLGISMKHCDSQLGGYYGIKKAKLYAMIFFSSYIPFGKAGYEYVQAKLGEKPVWEMQYENAINNLKIDNAFFDDEEKAEIKSLFQRFPSDTMKPDFIGIIITFIKLGISKAEGVLKERYIFRVFDDMVNNALPNGDLNLGSYIPTEKHELDEEKIRYIEYALGIQSAYPIFEYPISREEYSAFVRGSLEGIILPRGDNTPRANDKIKLLHEPMICNATVASIEIYDSKDSVPQGIFATPAKWKNEGGDVSYKNGMLLLRVTPDKLQQGYGYFRESYSSKILGDVEIGNEFNFIIAESDLFNFFSDYGTFVLTDDNAKNSIMIETVGLRRLLYSKDELLKYFKPDLPCNITKEAINSLADSDWKKGVIFATVRRIQ